MYVRSAIILLILSLLFLACTDEPGASRVPDGPIVIPDLGDHDMTIPDMDEVVPDADPDQSMMPPQTCTSTSDCPAGFTCALVDGELVCVEGAGGGSTGQMCTDGQQCASGICLNGRCANPCTDNGDCPANYVCESREVPTDAGAIALDLCVPAPRPCESNAQCMDPDICLVSYEDGVSLHCGPRAGDGILGNACVSNSDCQSNVCQDGICTNPCERAADCGEGYLCQGQTLIGDNGVEVNVNLCTPRPPDTCLSDAECTAPQRCIAQRDITEVQFICGEPNAGGGTHGDACSDDSECAQNLCVNDVCAGPCESTGDCRPPADYNCEVVQVEVSQGNFDSAQICVAPLDCTSNDDCRPARNEICYVRQTQDQVDLICRSPNASGGSLGQLCSNAQACASNLCLETRVRDVCSLPCDDNQDCNVPGYSCVPRTVTSGQASETINVCAPAALTPCTSRDDCATGTTCAIVSNEAQSALESVCVPTFGGKAAGTTCVEDEECAGLVCLGGFCAAPCVENNQCGNQQICRSNQVAKDGLSGSFDVCETLADQVCDSTADCTDGVRVCGGLRAAQGGGVETFCVFPNPSPPASQLGSQCMQNNNCRENVCLGISTECSVFCEANQNCSATQICTTYAVQQTEVGFCNTACSRNADCSSIAGNLCTINSNARDNRIDQVCTQPIGNELLGAECTTGAECDTGLCLSLWTYGPVCTNDDQCPSEEVCRCPIDEPNCTQQRCASQTLRCTNLCQSDEDCTGGVVGNELTQCSSDVIVDLPAGGTVTIATCSTP